MQNLINRLIVWAGIPFLRLLLRLPHAYLNADRRAEISELLAEYDRKIVGKL